MATTKVAISIEETLLKQVDELVRKNIFPNRSKAIQNAVEEQLKKIHKIRLAVECAKLDPNEEQELAEEGISLEADEWPEY